MKTVGASAHVLTGVAEPSHSDRVASLVLGATWARLDARLRQLFMFRKRAVGEWAPGEVGQPQPVRPDQLAGWGSYQQDTLGTQFGILVGSSRPFRQFPGVA